MSWPVVALAVLLMVLACYLAIWALCRMLAPQSPQEWREEDERQSGAVKR